jgi:hypothetical protein
MVLPVTEPRSATLQDLQAGVLVTRLLAAAGSHGLPFATFEATLADLRERLQLPSIDFDVYAGSVVYSNEIRQGVDQALAHDWVRFVDQHLVTTPAGLRALQDRAEQPQPHEREAFASLAA